MPPNGREVGFKHVLSILRCLKPGNVVIVETGTIRNEESAEDGWSTLIFGWYCRKYGGKVYTIDFNPDHIEICKRVTVEYSDLIEYIVGRGDDSLKTLDVSIDLLYLDSAHGLNAACEEFDIAKSKLAPNALVMVDDADHKGKKLIPKLKKEGWRIAAYLYNPCQQTILIKDGK